MKFESIEACFFYICTDQHQHTMINTLKRNIHWILIGFIGIFFLIYSLLSAGYYGGTDNVTHYLFSHFAFKHPGLFLNSWARPLYTIMSAPFAQFGFHGIKIFNILMGMGTAYFCYRIAKMLEIRHPLLVIILICFTPLYFLMLPTALTEILFSFVFALSFFLILRGNFIAAAMVISFLPFARSEGFVMLPVFFFVFLIYKQYKAIPFLAFGLVFFSLLGSFYYRDLFWVFTQFPYPVTYHHPIYNQAGSLWHFFEARDSIIGLPLELLFLAGIAQIVRECFSADRQVRRQAFLLCILALIPFLLYLAFHSILYWQAMGGSMGLGRVLAAMLPLAALVCLKGFQGLEKIFEFSRLAQRIFMAVVVAGVILVTIHDVSFPYPPTPEEATIRKTCDWFKTSPYAGQKFYWTDISTPFYLGVDHFESNPPNCYLLRESKTLDTIPPNSIIIWDAHFGSNESKVPPDTILSHPHLRLLKYFKPVENWITFGGYPYECYVMKVMLPGQFADNYAIRDSLIETAEVSSAVQNIFFTSFEPDPLSADTLKLSREFALNGRYSFTMDERTAFSPGPTQLVSTLPHQTHAAGIRFRVYVYLQGPPSDANTLMVISFENNHQSYSYTALNLNQQKLKPNHWNRVSLSAQLPEFKSPDDFMNIYIWNPGKQVFYLDDMKVDMVSIKN